MYILDVFVQYKTLLSLERKLQQPPLFCTVRMQIVKCYYVKTEWTIDKHIPHNDISGLNEFKALNCACTVLEDPRSHFKWIRW